MNEMRFKNIEDLKEYNNRFKEQFDFYRAADNWRANGKKRYSPLYLSRTLDPGVYTGGYGQGGDLINHIIPTCDLWVPIMKNYHNLFGKFPRKWNWSTDMAKNIYGTAVCYEGISMLCKGRSNNPRLMRKIAAFRRKLNEGNINKRTKGNKQARAGGSQ